MASGADLVLKKIQAKDCDLFFKWVNDPLVRKNSFDSHVITFEEHKSWFNKRVSSDQSVIYIAYLNRVPVGQIRVDSDGLDGNIGYSVDKDYRGKGYGTRLLVLIIEQIKSHNNSIKKLVGKVKKDNIISQRAFEKANYRKEIKDEYIEYSILL